MSYTFKRLYTALKVEQEMKKPKPILLFPHQRKLMPALRIKKRTKMRTD